MKAEFFVFCRNIKYFTNILYLVIFSNLIQTFTPGATILIEEFCSHKSKLKWFLEIKHSKTFIFLSI